MIRVQGAIIAILALPVSALAQTGTIALLEVNVVAASPLGGAMDRDKVPGTIQTLTSDDVARTESPIVTETLFQRIPGLTLSDPNGNGAAQVLSYRGYAASPLQGTPQRIAVYMNGIRFNEAFGDRVNWDLIPTNAIDRSDLWTLRTGSARWRLAFQISGRPSSFGVAAATPIQLLDLETRAVFTTPQTTDNKMGCSRSTANTRSPTGGRFRAISTSAVAGSNTSTAIWRTPNAAATARARNSAISCACRTTAFPDRTRLPPRSAISSAVLDQNNNTIPCPPGSGNTCNATPYGTIDRTANHATTLGASLQAASTEKLFDRGNNLLLGGSIDHNTGNFNADSTLGFTNPDLTVATNPAIPGNGAIIHTLGGFGYGPVDTDTGNKAAATGPYQANTERGSEGA